MASDCPEPEVCRRCHKEGHMKDDCQVTRWPTALNQKSATIAARKATAQPPDPEVCRRCRKEGHKVAECPDPQICNRCVF